MKNKSPHFDDPQSKRLWKMAQQRANVKRNLTMYVIVNVVLILIWVKTQGFPLRFDNFWPGWVLFGWGIALIFNFRSAYGMDLKAQTNEEYERLREEQQRATGA